MVDTISHFVTSIPVPIIILRIGCTIHHAAGKRANRKVKHSPSNCASANELTAALNQLELSPHKHHGMKIKALKTEVAVVAQERISTLKEFEKEDDEIPPLAERLKAKENNVMSFVGSRFGVEIPPVEQPRMKTTQHTEHSDCDEIPSLAKSKSGKQTCYTRSTVPLTGTYEHAQNNPRSKETQDEYKVSLNSIGQLRGSEKNLIVISDSSSESETEDPLNPSGTWRTTVQYQYCKSSDNESSSSDDELPILVNQIGKKRHKSSSPLKAKLFPTKDLVVQSETQPAQVATDAKRKLGFLSGSSCGSAESPIVID